jgi:hypothetical protein
MDDREFLKCELKRLNAMIGEAEARLGAHSVKPILMQHLFELEEEKDAVLQQLSALSDGGGITGP